MKKILLSFISAFLLFTLSAQVAEDFSDYTVDGKLAQQAQAMGRDYWTTWNSNPGSAEDGVVGEIEGNKVGKFAWGNDQILLLGGKNSGTWEASLKIFVPAGQCGYFNICANFQGPQSKWAFQVYFNKNGTAPGFGTMDAGGADAASFTFSHDTWIPVKLNMNLDTDEASVYINGNLIHTWQYTHGTFGPDQGGCPRTIDALNIYPPTAGKSTFYIDDIVFEPIGGPTSSLMEVTPDEISESVVFGATEPITKTITVKNTGTSIGEYLSWISFGEGEDGDVQNFTLTYSNEYGNGIGFSLDEPTWVEIAAKFPASYFCDKIGTYINKLSYFVPYNLGGDPIIFKIYGPQTDNTGPGKLLAETSLNSYTIDTWNDVTLPDPFLLDGREIWISVHFTHLIGAFPIACDQKPVPAGTNWIRYANYSWSDWGSDFGDFMIRGLLEGKTTPACWMSLSGNNYGSVPMGNTKTFNVVLNAAELAPGEYNATLMVETNDEEHALFEIPCTFLIVNGTALDVNPKFITETIELEEGKPTSKSITITVSNNGNEEGDYEATIAETTAWLTLTGDTEGTVPAGENKTFTAVLEAEDLEEDTYEATIIITTTDDNNPTFEIPCTLTVTIKDGIDGYAIQTLVYPNPAQDQVTVKSNTFINNIQVFNNMGQMVFATNVNGEETVINTSNYNAGIYFLQINTTEGSQNVKLIIK